MTTTKRRAAIEPQYHPHAYEFLFAALRHTQERLARRDRPVLDEDDAHLTGQQLLEGIRAFALTQFGLLTVPVFRNWGIRATDDFGRIVFELVERGEMRKTERDHISDFHDVYDFQEAFDEQYRPDVRHACRLSGGAT
ncbi:MAG: Minf_1886 family protein [Planctomycetales bacterium]